MIDYWAYSKSMRNEMLRKIVTLAVCISALSGCSYLQMTKEDEDDYPRTRSERQLEEMGKLTGEGVILSGGKRGSSAATDGINVNSYLWRASLDTVYKMPLVSADPFGGVIITDWYRPTPTSNERYKLNISIIGGELRSDAVRVSAFKQVHGKGGTWGESVFAQTLSHELEDQILLKARELKYRGVR